MQVPRRFAAAARKPGMAAMARSPMRPLRGRAAMQSTVAGWLACAVVCAASPAAAQQIYGDPKVPAAGKVLGTVVHTRDVDELRYVVLKRLTDRYATDQGIEVTQAEKQAYISQVQDTLKRDRQRHEARRDELSRQLAAPGLTQAQRDALTVQLDAARSAVAALGQDTGSAQEDRAAREQVAAAFIRQWKINRALHRQYGGRIAFQQGGPEPVDAYRRFLEQHQARGDFEIPNADLRAAFWRYYVDDTIHSFYERGSKEELQAFETPPWLRR
jgi:hypothetical protein